MNMIDKVCNEEKANRYTSVEKKSARCSTCPMRCHYKCYSIVCYVRQSRQHNSRDIIKGTSPLWVARLRRGCSRRKEGALAVAHGLGAAHMERRQIDRRKVLCSASRCWRGEIVTVIVRGIICARRGLLDRVGPSQENAVHVGDDDEQIAHDQER